MRQVLAAASLASLVMLLAPLPASAQSTAKPPKDLPQPGPGESLVAIEADRPETTLYRANGGTTVFLRQRAVWSSVVATSYVPVCVAPCYATVPSGAWLRVGGPGAVASEEFRVPHFLPGAKGGGITVKVGSASARRLGWGILGLGIVTTVLGGAYLVSGILRDPDPLETKFYNEPMAFQRAQDDAQLSRTVGLVMLPLGGVVSLLGGILVVANSTDVTNIDGTTIARRPGALRF